MAGITRLPLLVANTHGHVDHALGNDQFDRVYIAEADARELDPQGVAEKRAYIRDNLLLTEVQEPPTFRLWGTGARRRTLDLRDGQEIDLGDRTITALLVPGHTGGSACFLDRSSRGCCSPATPSCRWPPGDPCGCTCGKAGLCPCITRG